MHPITTTETNTVFGAGQDEYNNYPGHLDADKMVFTACWALTRAERIQILLTGRIWVKHYIMKGPLQPFSMQVQAPELEFAMAEPPQDYVPGQPDGSHVLDHSEKDRL